MATTIKKSITAFFKSDKKTEEEEITPDYNEEFFSVCDEEIPITPPKPRKKTTEACGLEDHSDIARSIDRSSTSSTEDVFHDARSFVKGIDYYLAEYEKALKSVASVMSLVKPVSLTNALRMIIKSKTFRARGIMQLLEIYNCAYTPHASEILWLAKWVKEFFFLTYAPNQPVAQADTPAPNPDDPKTLAWLPKEVRPYCGILIMFAMVVTGTGYSKLCSNAKNTTNTGSFIEFAKLLKHSDTTWTILKSWSTPLCNMLGVDPIDSDADIMELTKEAQDLSDHLSTLVDRGARDPIVLADGSVDIIKLSKKVDVLRNTSNEILKEKGCISANARSAVGFCVKNRNKLVTMASLLNENNSAKMEPVVVYLYGNSGLGKSKYAQYLVECLSAYHGRTLSSYTRNSSDQFWSTYCGQDVVIYDDFGSLETSEEGNELIGIYSPNAYPLKLADTAEKGRRFVSKYVIICSNIIAPKFQGQTNCDALERRRDFLIKVENPGLQQFLEKQPSASRSDWTGWKSDYSHLVCTPLKRVKDGLEYANLVQNGSVVRFTADDLVGRSFAMYNRKSKEYAAHLSAKIEICQAPLSTENGYIYEQAVLNSVPTNCPIYDDDFTLGTVDSDTSAHAKTLQDPFKVKQARDIATTLTSEKLVTQHQEQQKQEALKEVSNKANNMLIANSALVSWRKLAADYKKQYPSVQLREPTLQQLADLIPKCADGDYIGSLDDVERLKIAALSSTRNNLDVNNIQLQSNFKKGLVLIGEPGVGKTTLATELDLAQFDEGFNPSYVMNNINTCNTLYDEGLGFVITTNHDHLMNVFSMSDQAFKRFTRRCHFVIMKLDKAKDKRTFEEVTLHHDGSITSISRLTRQQVVAKVAVMDSFKAQDFAYVPSTGDYDTDFEVSLPVNFENLRSVNPASLIMKAKFIKGNPVKGVGVISSVVPAFNQIKTTGVDSDTTKGTIIAINNANVKYANKSLKVHLLDDSLIFRSIEGYLRVALVEKDKVVDYKGTLFFRNAQGQIRRLKELEVQFFKGTPEQERLPENRVNPSPVSYTICGYLDVLFQTISVVQGLKYTYDNLSDIFSSEPVYKYEGWASDMEEEEDEQCPVTPKWVNSEPKGKKNNSKARKNTSDSSKDQSTFKSINAESGEVMTAAAQQPAVIAPPVVEAAKPAEAKAQGCVDEAHRVVVIKVQRNVYKVAGGNAVMLKANMGVTNNHLAPEGEIVLWKSDVKYIGKVIKRIPRKDQAFFIVTDKTFPSAADITMHLRKRGDSMLRTPALACFKFGETFLNYTVEVEQVTNINLKMDEKDDIVESIMYAFSTRMKYDSMATKAGDCGSVLIAVNPQMPRKFLGIHMAASPSNGYACNLMLEDLPQEIVAQGAPMQCLPDGLHFSNETSFERIGTTVNHLGNPTKKFASGKTQFRRSPLLIEPPLEERFEPAILSKFDKRNTNQVDPLGKNIAKWDKFKTESSELDLWLEMAQYHIAQLSKNNIQLKRLTKTEAINRATGYMNSNAMYMHSSSGFPYSSWPGVKQKEPMLNFDGTKYTINMNHVYGKTLNRDIDEITRDASKGESLGIVFECMLKDEERPMRKIYDVKSRSIACSPLHFTIMFRQYFHTLTASLMEYRSILPIKVGVAPTTYEWQEIYDYLTEYNIYCFDGDVEHFDASVPSKHIEHLGHFYNEFYKAFDPNNSEYDATVRISTYKELSKPILASHGIMYRSSQGGIISGQPNTCMDDSWIIRYYYYQVWRSIVENVKEMRDMGCNKSYSSFCANVKMIIQGDDHVVSPRPCITPYFNFTTCKYFFKEVIGLNLTPGKKTDGDYTVKHVKDCTFLSRSFRQSASGPIVGPLNNASFDKMLSWTTVRKAKSWNDVGYEVEFDEETISAVCDSAQYEAALKGPKFHAEMIEHLNKCSKKWKFEWNYRGKQAEIFNHMIHGGLRPVYNFL